MRVWVSLLLPVFLVYGCAVTPKPPTSKPVVVSAPAKAPLQLGNERQSRFARVDTWKILGKLGVRKGDEGFSAGIEWKQEKDKFDIRLIDPLGRRVAWLQGDLEAVSLKTVDGKEFKAATASELLDAQLGWSFPVKSLFYWVKGLFDPALVVWRQEYDDDGKLVLLDQGEWRVTFPKYHDIGREYVPKLAVLKQKDVRVKFLIREWE